jgi:hypothetical protein
MGYLCLFNVRSKFYITELLSKKKHIFLTNSELYKKFLTSRVEYVCGLSGKNQAVLNISRTGRVALM